MSKRKKRSEKILKMCSSMNDDRTVGYGTSFHDDPVFRSRGCLYSVDLILDELIKIRDNDIDEIYLEHLEFGLKIDWKARNGTRDMVLIARREDHYNV